MNGADVRVVIITGASQGLGFDMAHAFANEGARLTITGRTAEKLEKKAEALRALGAEVLTVVGDVGSRTTAEDTIARTLHAFGRIDTVINNAQTLSLPVPLIEQDDEHIGQVIGSGLFGTLYFMQSAYLALRETKGSIINIGSGQGVAGGLGTASYAAAKEGVRALSRVAAREWGKDGIRINVICPGAWSSSYETWFKDKPEELAATFELLALGRPADGYRDLGSLAVYLASPRCFLTGQTIYLDGGAIMP
jgi:NAD(P)-dependent dehydrogenase (short-subunit alcohol dehydrogenase family)